MLDEAGDELVEILHGIGLASIFAQTDRQLHRAVIHGRELEVEEARDLPGLHEHIVIVQVAMDQALGQPHCAEPLDLLLHVLVGC